MTSSAGTDRGKGPGHHGQAREFFVGIDSDGCVFDTMGVKHKECFIPAFIEHYDLASVAKLARETAEFINLQSKRRGINRFPGYLLGLEMLAEHPEVIRRGVKIPTASGLKDWIGREKKLGNPALAAEVARTNDPDLAQALRWSEAVNRAVEAIVRDVPPFPQVRECLEMMGDRAEVVVISSTPGEALAREWAEHGLSG